MKHKKQISTIFALALIIFLGFYYGTIKTVKTIVNETEESTFIINETEDAPEAEFSVAEKLAIDASFRKEHSISIVGFKFEPETLMISKGESVIWINKDTRPHKVVAYDRTFNGDRMQPLDSYEFIFNETGEYPYFDSVWPKFGKGKIVVVE